MLNLTIPQMLELNHRMKTTYDIWIANAPASYKSDGFFTGRRPVAITSRYGQNQLIGGSEANAGLEDRNWTEDRPWDKLSHVTVALATHIQYVFDHQTILRVFNEWWNINRAKQTRGWTNREDIDEVFEEAGDDGLYDSSDPFEREPITREELEDHPLHTENGDENRIFNEAGFAIPRRYPRILRSTKAFGGLVDFSDIHEMFGPPADVDDDDNVQHTKYQVYPQAGLLSCGHIVAQGLMYPLAIFINKLQESLGLPDTEEMDVDWEGLNQPGVFGISSQMYNSVMHNTRGNSAQQHGVVLGNVTAALAGYWAQSNHRAEAFKDQCDAQLPHDEYLVKITQRPLSRDLRVENVIGITMSAIHPTRRTGRYRHSL